MYLETNAIMNIKVLCTYFCQIFKEDLKTNSLLGKCPDAEL